MSPECFKNWLEGFSESVEKLPTEKQWKRIKEVLKTVYSINSYGPTIISSPSVWTTTDIYKSPICGDTTFSSSSLNSEGL